MRVESSKSTLPSTRGTGQTVVPTAVPTAAPATGDPAMQTQLNLVSRTWGGQRLTYRSWAPHVLILSIGMVRCYNMRRASLHMHSTSTCSSHPGHSVICSSYPYQAWYSRSSSDRALCLPHSAHLICSYHAHIVVEVICSLVPADADRNVPGEHSPTQSCSCW